MSVTTDGSRIGDLIYWDLWNSAWLHFTIHTHTTVQSRFHLPLFGSGFQRRTFPSSGFPNYPRPQLPHQQLTTTEPQTFSNSLIDWLTRSLTNQQNSTQPTQSQSQSQSYFTTGGLPPISLSWRQAPWDPRRGIFFSSNWTLAVLVLM
jgi:hypothetical protein